MEKVKIKNYDQSFLYGKGEYGKSLMEFIIRSERVDKSDPGFEDIRYMVKRNQYTACLSALLEKPNVVLMINTQPMPRAFKVFAAKDIKEDKLTKVFIDVSEIIKYQNNKYVLKNRDVDILISYLACALNTYMYYSNAQVLLNNTTMLNAGAQAFSKLTANIIDYMRIGGVDKIRNKVAYIASMYYQLNILNKSDTPSTYQRAIKISGLSTREAEVLDVMVPLSSYENIETFVQAIAKVLRVENELKLDNFIDKWLFLYGSGTQFATEMYIAFANMLINAYVGAYINNQKQIEKFVGRDMVDFTNMLFKLGSDVL